MAQFIKSQKSGKSLTMENDGNATLNIATGKYFAIGAVRFYSFTSAITSAVTTTTAPAGSFAVTSNATGRGVLFSSNGSVWTTINV